MMCYVVLIPTFALFYYLLPDNQFHISDGAGTGFLSWIYYSVVTISTLGYGDYTPTSTLAQMVTSLETMCGVVLLGFFLNAVASMKSSREIARNLTRQQRFHDLQQRVALGKSALTVLRLLSRLTDQAVAQTPLQRRQFLNLTARVSVSLFSLQTKADLSAWPDFVDHAFSFVARYHLFVSRNAHLEEESDKYRMAFDSFCTSATALAATLTSELTEIISDRGETSA